MIHATRIWLPKVDNTFVITHHDKIDLLAENKISGNIKFTVNKGVNMAMSFLDCLIGRTNKDHIKTALYMCVYMYIYKRMFRL